MGHERLTAYDSFQKWFDGVFRMARKFSGMEAHREKMARYERKMTVI